jgi:hypothetical protein
MLDTPSCVGVDAQAAKAAISIRSTKQWIMRFLFFIAITPLFKFVVKWLIAIPFLLKISKDSANRRFASQSADQSEDAKYNKIDGNNIIQ